MTKVFKLRKGLNIALKGQAALRCEHVALSKEVALLPDSFPGITPKVMVHVGDKVKAGDALFVNKLCPEVIFSSPVSGVVSDVVRGNRRKVLRVVVTPDDTQEYVDFGVADVSKLSADEIIKLLCSAGLFGYINQLPYAISTTPDTKPKAIFVSALRDKPLAANFEYEIEGQEAHFKTGLTALAKIAKTYLGIGPNQNKLQQFQDISNVDINIFDGPCPAGNVGVQVNHISPVNKGETVWTIDPTTVLFIGRLLNTGKVDLRRKIAIVGSEVKDPCYIETIIGEQLSTLLQDRLLENKDLRIVNGNVLTGCKAALTDYVDSRASEITIIPEGNNANELLGWILPRLNQFSVSHSYFSWLLPKKDYVLDARIKGGRRHMIMSGEYDKVIPMDIYAEYLIKAIIVGDIDKMEALGIYEVSPEDFALAEFVDSSKLELQSIVRAGLDMLRKENA